MPYLGEHRHGPRAEGRVLEPYHRRLRAGGGGLPSHAAQQVRRVSRASDETPQRRRQAGPGLLDRVQRRPGPPEGRLLPGPLQQDGHPPARVDHLAERPCPYLALPKAFQPRGALEHLRACLGLELRVGLLERRPDLVARPAQRCHDPPHALEEVLGVVVADPRDDALRVGPLPDQLAVELAVESPLDGAGHRRRQQECALLLAPESGLAVLLRLRRLRVGTAVLARGRRGRLVEEEVGGPGRVGDESGHGLLAAAAGSAVVDLAGALLLLVARRRLGDGAAGGRVGLRLGHALCIVLQLVNPS